MTTTPMSTTEPLLASVVRYAVRAPSGHNTQPWQFRLDDDTLELWADRSRALAVADPHDRELVISCGAALYNLRLALMCHSREPLVARVPDPDRPDLLATIRLGCSHSPTPIEEEMFGAIDLRSTCRGEYAPTMVPRDAVAALVQAAGVEGSSFEVIGDDERAAVAELVAEGDRQLASDPLFRDELAHWVRAHEDAPDGIPARALGMPPWLGALNMIGMRFVPWGRLRAREDRRLALAAPLVAVLCTAGDEPEDWLSTGEALQHVLLRATAAGLSAGFLNQPVEVRELRVELARALQLGGVPQLVMRFGYGRSLGHAGRRPVAEVLEQSAN